MHRRRLLGSVGGGDTSEGLCCFLYSEKSCLQGFIGQVEGVVSTFGTGLDFLVQLLFLLLNLLRFAVDGCLDIEEKGSPVLLLLF